MTRTLLRFALVGYGKVAHIHAKALNNIAGADLVAVCGHHLGRAQTFAGVYGVSAYENLTYMIQAEEVDAVIVCTPHPAHATAAVEAARAHVHILVEKPLAANLSDCDAIIEAARTHNVKAGVISQRRFYEPVQRIKRAIDAGKIGKPVLGHVMMYGWRDKAYYDSDPWRGTWDAEGGGVLVNQAPHQLDLLQWYMGPIESLFGYWGNLNHPYIEVEDTAVAVLRFKNGGLGNILVSNAQKPGIYGKVHVHGENGASVGVQTEGGAMFIAGMSDIQEPPFNDIWTIPGEEASLTAWQAADRRAFEAVEPQVHYIQRQIEDFVSAIRDDRPPLVTVKAGRVTTEIFTALYRSQQTGQPVFFPVQAST